MAFLGLIDNLISVIENLKYPHYDSEWADYYDDINYSSDAFNHKKQIISELLKKEKPKKIWDIGANVGVFSRIADNKGIQTISFDIDPSAVEKNYLECIKKGDTNILPLLIDLTNPSPGIGWRNRERMSIIERGPTDTVIALALIHHLAISNNLPFNEIASFFNNICTSLIIEYVPKRDSQVQRLLRTRQDIFLEYTQNIFELEFNRYFTIQSTTKIKNSERIIYLMKRKNL
jgi:hypothetical protein